GADRTVPQPPRSLARLDGLRGRTIPRGSLLLARANWRRAARRDHRRDWPAGLDLPAPRPPHGDRPELGLHARHASLTPKAEPEGRRLAPRGADPASRLRGHGRVDG